MPDSQQNGARSNLNILDLGSISQSLAQNRRTGTLHITGRGGRDVYVYFKTGFVRLVKNAISERDLLAEAVFRSKRLNLIQLGQAQETCQQLGGELFDYLVSEGLFEKNNLQAMLGAEVVEVLSSVMVWQDVHCEFHEDTALEPHLSPALIERCPAVPVDGIMLEAARRADEWERIRRVFDPAREVFALLHDVPEDNSQEDVDVSLLLNGERDVSEIDKLSPLSWFQVCTALLRLASSGYVQALGAAELLQLGEKASAQGDWSKALRVYGRAHSIDRKLPGLAFGLATAYQSVGKIDAAESVLIEYIDECMRTEVFDEAEQACRRLVKCSADKPDHHARLFRSVLRIGDTEKLAVSGKNLVAAYEKAGTLERAAEVLSRLREMFPNDVEIAESDARIRLATAERTEALIEYEKLADSYVESGDLENAVRVFRKIVDDVDEECLEARLQMAECLIQLERVDEAILEYEKLAAILSKTGVFEGNVNLPFVLKIHKRVVELSPENTFSRHWLAKTYASRGEREQSIAEFDKLLGIYEKTGDGKNVVSTLELLAEFFPDAIAHREKLADCYLNEEGGRGKAQIELQDLCRAAWEREDFIAGERIALRLLDLNPFNMEAQVLVSEALLGKGETELAVEKMLSVALMYMGANQLEEAEEVFKEALKHVGQSVDAHRFLGAVLDERGKQREAAEHYKQVGLLSLENADYGMARTYLEGAKAVLKQDSEIEEAIKALV
jgi:tetratricopeptide (TPR) repeat protein